VGVTLGLPHVWKSDSALAYDLSHQVILTSCGWAKVGGYSRWFAEDLSHQGILPDVFPDDLLRMPPEGAIEFKIELQPGTSPISKAPYKMPQEEWVELKIQL
jgi:hypothetical protein